MIISSLQEFYHKLIKDQPILAIDFGMKKLGIAVSNQEHSFAMPVATIINDSTTIDEISKLIQKFKACAIVIGIPINIQGEINQQAKLTSSFAKKIEKNILLPIYMQDERFTSKAADALLKSAGLNRRDRSQRDDMIASSLILTSVLDSMAKL